MGMKSEGQGCILADEMGLGKTIQGIALIWTLMSELDFAPALPRRTPLIFFDSTTEQNPFWGAGTGVIERAVIVCPVTLVKVRRIRRYTPPLN